MVIKKYFRSLVNFLTRPRNVSLTLLSGVAMHSAAQVDCSGKIEALGIARDSGIVTVSIIEGPQGAQLCSVNNAKALNDIPGNICRTLFSTLIDAKIKQQDMTIRFHEHEECSAPGLQHQPTGPLIWYSQFEMSEGSS